MDAGIATEANIEWLEAQGYDGICVRRRPPQHEPDATLKTKAAHTVRAWQGHSSADESLVYVVSEAKQYRKTEKAKPWRKRFEEALQALYEGLTKPYCTIRYDKIMERIGRIKEKHDLVAYHYEVTVVKGQTPNAKAVQCKRKARREDDDEAIGAYVLRTSHTDWSLEKRITTYWRLSEIEATFRSLKSELGLRPLYHFEDHRIAAPLGLRVPRGSADPHPLDQPRHSSELEHPAAKAQQMAPHKDHPPGHGGPTDREHPGCRAER